MMHIYTADCGRTFWIFMTNNKDIYSASRYSDTNDPFGAERHSTIRAADFLEMVSYWQMEED